MATRGRKASAKTESSQVGLLDALRFVTCATRPDGLPYQAHAVLHSGNVYAFDGGVVACHAIDSDLKAAPHLANLITALSKSNGTISITVTDGGKLSIKSGKLRALVNCLDLSEVPTYPEPDPICANITDDLKNAIKTVAECCNDSDADVTRAGVFIKSNSVMAMDGRMLMECWHGIDLPELLIPKASALAICKPDKPFKNLGFSHNGMTIYYEDGSYIRTCLFDAQYPNTEKLFDREFNPWPLPSGFWDGLDSIVPFVDKDLQGVYFTKQSMQTHLDGKSGASYDIEGLPEFKAYNPKYLKLAKPHCDKVDFGKDERANLIFFGKNVRGIIAPIFVKKTEVNDQYIQRTSEKNYSDPESPDYMEDDIPF